MTNLLSGALGALGAAAFSPWITERLAANRRLCESLRLVIAEVRANAESLKDQSQWSANATLPTSLSNLLGDRVAEDASGWSSKTTMLAMIYYEAVRSFSAAAGAHDAAAARGETATSPLEIVLLRVERVSEQGGALLGRVEPDLAFAGDMWVVTARA